MFTYNHTILQTWLITPELGIYSHIYLDCYIIKKVNFVRSKRINWKN